MAGQRAKRCLKLLAPSIDAAITLPSRDIGGHIEPVIHNAEVAIVVQHTLIGRITGKDCHPEVDIRL